jgi:AcrR family transcriptional regulator
MSVADTAIMQVAVDLFFAKGYTSVSTREIAQKASITEMTLFRKFHTKRELFDRILKEYWPNSVSVFASESARVFDTKEDVKAFVQKLFSTHDQRWKIARIIVISPELMDKALFEFIQEALSQFIISIRKSLMQCFENNIIPENVRRKLNCKVERDFDILAMQFLAQAMGFFLLGEIFKVASKDVWEQLEQDYIDRITALFFD